MNRSPLPQAAFVLGFALGAACSAALTLLAVASWLGLL